MALREGDAWGFLKLKQQMVEADHLAVFSDGRKVPVFIYNNGGQQQYCIEGENCFYEAQKCSGFVKFEKILEPVVEPPAPPEPTPQDIFNERMSEARKANPGANELSLRLRVSEQLAKEALASRQENRQGQQSTFGELPSRLAGFAAAAKRERNIRFSQR